MSVWFEGEGRIDCNVQDVAHALENLGEFYVGVVRPHAWYDERRAGGTDR